MCKADILERLEISILEIYKRLSGHRTLAKKYPKFMAELESISNHAKEQVVAGLMDVYKFQHTI